jgi:hypothetical protein
MSFCRKMNKTDYHHIKLNQPDLERQILHGFCHMWNLDFKRDESRRGLLWGWEGPVGWERRQENRVEVK